jgi:hypothetical protein
VSQSPRHTRALLVFETDRAHRITARTPPPRLPASQRYTSREKGWKRYEKPLPGNRLQIDVKFIEPTDIGAEFPTEFHRHVLDKDIAHTYIKPASPHLDGQTPYERPKQIFGSCTTSDGVSGLIGSGPEWCRRPAGRTR